jgi:hypothetical protein
MTREDIIKMAWEAGFQVLLPRDHVDGTGGVYVEDDDIAEMLERFAALVAAREREECAKVCEDADIVDFQHCMVLHQDAAKTLTNAAAAIRARGET